MTTMTEAPPSSSLAALGIDLAALGIALDADLARQPEPDPAPAPTVRTAQRVTMLEAKSHFDAGGDVVVSERGREETCLVTPNTVVHSNRTTTWKKLREQVTSWRNRWPNQRYYIVPDTATPHGYICKECRGPAPVGVGYIATGEDAAERSAAITACVCGHSQSAPAEPPVDPDRKSFAIPQVEAAATMVEAITQVLETEMPGKAKANVEKRERLIKALCAAVAEVPIYGIDIDDARLPIGDGADFGNATVETDGYGRAVTITVDAGTPIWDPQ